MFDSSQNMLLKLKPEQLQFDEFDHALSRHFRSAVHYSAERVTFYPGKPPYALKLTFNRKGELTGAYPEEALAEDDIEAIHAITKSTFLNSEGDCIGQAVFFSLKPVKGWWRYRDQFQILPLPDDAPRPKMRECNPFCVTGILGLIKY